MAIYLGFVFSFAFGFGFKLTHKDNEEKKKKKQDTHSNTRSGEEQVYKWPMESQVRNSEALNTQQSYESEMRKIPTFLLLSIWQQEAKV